MFMNLLKVAQLLRSWGPGQMAPEPHLSNQCALDGRSLNMRLRRGSFLSLCKTFHID